MIQLLDESYKFEPLPQVRGDAAGLAHWSIEDYPANIGSVCLDRRPPLDAKTHPSVEERKKLSPVPILWREERRRLDYPISCPAL